MMRAGLGLNLIAIVAIALAIRVLGSWPLPAW